MEIRSQTRPGLVLGLFLYSLALLSLSTWQYHQTYNLKQDYTYESQRLQALEQECLVQEHREHENQEQSIALLVEDIDKLAGKLSHGGERRRQTSLHSLFEQLMAVQEKILEDHCSLNSTLCVRGLKGQQGIKGVKGQPGLPGDKGQTGVPGEKGLPGQRGTKGERGDQGLPGLTGEKGLPGPQGDRGDKGEKGERGPRGEQGLVGSKGLPGPKGIRGPDGPRGDIGPKGIQGQSGTKGIKGVAGNNGLKGEKGLPGPDGKILDQGCICNARKFLPHKIPVTRRDFVINCTYSNGTVATGLISWEKDGIRLINPRMNKSRDDPHVTIPDVLPDDSGNYTCYSNGTFVSSFLLDVTGLTEYNCDFSGGSICRWNQTHGSGSYDWFLNSKATSTRGTGPQHDHTKGGTDGVYAYLETNVHARLDYAELLSPPMSGVKCLTLWYFMYGVDIESLIIGTQDSTGQYHKVKTITGNQGSIWRRLDVDLPASTDYRVTISGVKGRSIHGDIAIDDIVITDGPCI